MYLSKTKKSNINYEVFMVKKCVVICGKQNSGKSLLWDCVMGYEWNKGINVHALRNDGKNIIIRHLPDGLYKNINNKTINILLIAQSLEETGRIDFLDKILDSFEHDVLFISLQSKRNLEMLRVRYDITTFDINNKINGNIEIAKSYAEKIKEIL